jgi:fibronectin-binding autotransporter adhesin
MLMKGKILSLCSALILLAPTDGEAVTVFWNGGGGDNNWTTILNWLGGSPPTSIESADFSQSANTGGRFSPNLDVPATLVGMIIDSNTPYTFTGSLPSKVLTFPSGSSVVFNNTGPGTGNHIITNTMPLNVTAPLGITIDGFGGSLSIDAIQGSGGVTINNPTSGIPIFFTGTNTYLGNTTINRGNLNISTDSALGDPASNVIFTGGGTNAFLTVNGTITSARQFQSTATMNIQIPDISDIMSFTGQITGGGGVNFDGPGTFDVTGLTTNSNTGQTVINQATLNVSANNQLGVSDLNINGGTWNVLGSFTSTRRINLLAPSVFSSLIQVGPGVVLTLSDSSNSILGAIPFTIGGGGTVFLTGTGNNQYTGNTVVTGSTLQVSRDTALGDPISNVVLANSVFEATATFSTTRGFTTSGSCSVLVDSGAILTQTNTTHIINASGPFQKGGPGTLILTGPNPNIFSSGISLQSGILQGDTNTLQGPIADDATLNFNQNITGTFATSISGSGSVSMIGTGRLNLSAPNSYLGGTTISSGILALTGSGTLASTGNVTLSGATAEFDISAMTASSQTIGALNGVASSQVLLGGKTLITDNSSSPTYNGNISGVGGHFTVGGGGTLTLGGTNSYSGGTTVNSGILAGTVTSIQGNILNNGQVTITVPPFLGTYAGNMSGNGVLNKDGIGVLTLGGNNSYLGGTNLNQGALEGDTNGIQGNISSALTTSVNFNLTSNGSYTGALTGGALLTMTSGGGSTLTLTNPGNNYTGGTMINSGVLQVSSTTLPGNVVDDASLIFNQTVDGTFGGTISASGMVTKIGGATLILTAPNTYGGGTLVSFGSLQGNTTSLQGAINNNANVIFNQTVDGSYISQMTGSGTLNNIGPARLTLSNTNTYTGQTTVSAGTLAVTGSITSPVSVAAGTLIVNGTVFGPVSVSAGAFLKGTGTIVGNVSNSGTIKPGNSIGTLNVVGEVVFNAGSTFAVELNPAQTSLLNITGDLSLQTGALLHISPAAGFYAPLSQYVIAQTTGSVSGTFSAVLNDLPSTQFTVLYFPQQVILTIPITASNTGCGVTSGNSGKVVGALNGILPVAGSDLAFVFSQLSPLAPCSLKSALNQMQPSQTIGQLLSQQNNFNLVTSALRRRTNALHEMNCTETSCTTPPTEKPAAAAPSWFPEPKSKPQEIKKPCVEKKRWDLWEDVSFGLYREDHHNNNAGFHNKTILGTVGVDYHFPSNVYLGFVGAYTYSKIDWHRNQTKGSNSSYYGGLYASWLNRFAFVNLSAIGAYNNYANSRKIEFGAIDRHAQARHSGLSLDSHIDFGFILPRQYKFQLYPFAQLDYTYIHQQAYKEHSAKSLNLHIYRNNATMLRNEFGLATKYCIQSGPNFVVPSFKLSWVRELRFKGKHLRSRLSNDKAFGPPPGSFSVYGTYPDRSLIAPGAALTALFFDGMFNLTFTYEGEFGRRRHYNAGNVTFMVDF